MDVFTNKSVVVTGAAGALGLTVANAFAHAGANVTGIDVVNFKADFTTLKANLIELESTKTALAQVQSVDVLVNIAGGFTMGDIASRRHNHATANPDPQIGKFSERKIADQRRPN